MAEYYNYLFLISWPIGCLVICLYFFIIIRMYHKIKQVRRFEWDGWGIFVLANKIIFWIAIMFIYLVMFFHVYPDWFTKPVVLKGQVLNIDYDIDQRRYYMELHTENDAKLVNLWVDEETFRQIKLGTNVEIKHLFFRNEVYSCRVLSDEMDQEEQID